MTTDPRAGEEMLDFMSTLYPICRSITGDGLRDTLRLIQQRIPLELHEVPTGTALFDWTVPREWNVRDAYIKDANGRRIVDFQASNLHLVSYSAPVNRRVPVEELREHLFTIPEQPDRIPYRTSYYAESWGFCLAHRDLAQFTEDEYDVCIDSTLEPGHLTYGECVLPGSTTDEILVSTHACHPSMANDNLSGIAVATRLAEHLSATPHRYTYRFLFIPGTIGSIAWLARNEGSVDRIKHGLVLSCLGDGGRSTYKRSRRDDGQAMIDRAVEHVLRCSGQDYEILDFVPYGYDERQYCSPGFDLPVGCLTRTPNGRFPEYHTSGDDLAFVGAEHLADSFTKCLAVFDVLEGDATYLNLSPKCEPQLGKRGLYRNAGGHVDQNRRELALLWVLNFSDGRHSLLDIAERAGMDFSLIHGAARDLVSAGLLVDRSLRATTPRTAHTDSAGHAAVAGGTLPPSRVMTSSLPVAEGVA